MKALKSLKRLLFKIKYFSIFHLELYFINEILKLNYHIFLAKLYGLLMVGRDFFIKKYKNNDKEKICHIIGSGYSLDSSKHKIKNDDFVIGFNFSALSEIESNIHLIEFAGDKCSYVSQKQKQVLDDFIDFKKCDVYMKNIGMKRNSFSYCFKTYGNKIKYIKDIILITRNSFGLNRVIDKILNNKSNYFIQYCSSLISCIDLAKIIGFRKIILHGIDFSGPYFFDNMYKKEKYLPFKKNENYSKRKINDNHSTNYNNLGLKESLILIKDKLKKEKIKIFCATNNTPLNKILPNYYDN